MKKGIIIKIAILGGIIIVGAILIFSLSKNSSNFEYKQYVDRELGFQINYPKGWKIDKGNTPGSSGYKYVKFSGEVDRQQIIYSDWCDSAKYPAFIDIEKGSSFSSANFGSVTTEKDIENFFNSKNGVIEKFPINEHSNLFVSKAYTGTGQCFRNLYIAWAIGTNGEQYHITFAGDEDKYDFIRPFFESFKLIN